MMMTIKKWNNLESSRVFTDWRKKWSGLILMQNIAVFHEYVWNHIYVDQNNSFAVQNWDLSRACVRCCYKKIPSAKCFLHIVWWLVSNKSEIHSIRIKCVPSFWNFLRCMKPLFLYSVVWNTVYVRKIVVTLCTKRTTLSYIRWRAIYVLNVIYNKHTLVRCYKDILHLKNGYRWNDVWQLLNLILKKYSKSIC